MEDRLKVIKAKKKKNNIYYSSYNPASDLMYDIEDGNEDFLWMIYEIERLREENRQLKEFVEHVKGTI
ncbi:MAG: hypothetical protein J7K04_16085 [Spirochaetales bacterium]|nr:hypothetical protein [Spirochaetales bacterium]RKX86350.1 MAG: hypothetical protein DRP57_01745 [Spirochaetota bacterium]